MMIILLHMYLSYTRMWIDKVNRGGLYFIDDHTYLLFLAIEYSTYMLAQTERGLIGIILSLRR